MLTRDEQRIEKMRREWNRNVRPCICFHPSCDKHLAIGEGHAIVIPSLGQRYLCNEHYALADYHDNARARRIEGIKILGTEKKTSLAQTTISVEFEYVGNNRSDKVLALRGVLNYYGLCLTESDCTVSGESPISPSQGLASISKILQSIEAHGQLPLLSNENCGAHIHCGSNKVEYLKRYYHSVFIPLCEYIDSLGSDKRVEVFGSDWRGYAHTIGEYSSATEHSNFVNMQHSATLEFRLPRVKSYLQYMNVLKMWREIVCYINNYDFDEHNLDNNIRLGRAKKCGQHIVKIARKYCE